MSITCFLMLYTFHSVISALLLCSCPCTQPPTSTADRANDRQIRRFISISQTKYHLYDVYDIVCRLQESLTPMSFSFGSPLNAQKSNFCDSAIIETFDLENHLTLLTLSSVVIFRVVVEGVRGSTACPHQNILALPYTHENILI